jgi:hypothetical protein
MSPRERDLVLLRLANEVDDRTDLGLLHGRQPRLDDRPLIELAQAVDQPGLASTLRGLAEEEAGAEVEPGVRNEEAVPFRFERPPSAAQRAAGMARRVAGRIRRVGR